MKRLLLILSLLPLFASATMIQWYCVPGSPLQQADGTALSSDFRFELGVFKVGFIPTLANRDLWSANWVPAQRAAYNEGNQWFTGVYTVTENSGNFVQNADAWIWGFAGDAESGEWILFRNTSWKWPKANPNSPNPRSWNASKANEILIGDIVSGGTQLMRSGKVRGFIPPTTTWAQWLADTGKAPDSASLLEFATGSPYSRLSLHQQSGELMIHVPRRADRPAQVELQVSTDLVSWRPAEAFAHLLDQTPTGLIFRKNQSTPDEDRILFFRSAVSLP